MLSCDEVAEVHHEQAKEETAGGVTCHLEEAAVGYAGVVFVDEGRKGGKAAAETDREEQPPVLANGTVPLEKAVEHAYGETSEKVCRESAPQG